MSEFLVGVFSAIVLYIMTYSYLTVEMRNYYTDRIVGPVLDTIFFIGSFTLAGATSSSLFLATGLSVGFSLIMRFLAFFNQHLR